MTSGGTSSTAAAASTRIPPRHRSSSLRQEPTRRRTTGAGVSVTRERNAAISIIAGRLHRWRLGGALRTVDARVEAARGEEIRMRPRLHHPSPIEHEHEVGVREPRQAMRAQDDGDPSLRRASGPNACRIEAMMAASVRTSTAEKGSSRTSRAGASGPAAARARASPGAAAGRRRSGRRLPDLGIEALRKPATRPRWRPAGSPPVNAVVSSSRRGRTRCSAARSPRKQGVLWQIADEPAAFGGRQAASGSPSRSTAPEVTGWTPRIARASALLPDPPARSPRQGPPPECRGSRPRIRALRRRDTKRHVSQ